MTKKKDVEGFGAAAEILFHSFYAQILKKKGASYVSGTATNAFKELRTTFAESLKPVKKKSPLLLISQSMPTS